VRQAAEAMRQKAAYRGRHSAATRTPDRARAALLAAGRPSHFWTRRRTAALVAVLAALGGLSSPVVDGLTGLIANTSRGSSPQAADDAVLIDLLDRSNDWKASRNDTRGSCTAGGSLTVTRTPSSTVQCVGPPKVYSDQSIDAFVKLTTPNVCAAIWMHFIMDTGYRVTVCADRVGFDTDHDGDIRYPSAAPLDLAPPQHWRHTEIQLHGSSIVITIDGEQKITSSLPAPRLRSGRVMLGLVNDHRTRGAIATGQVAFADLEVRPLTRPRES
jgi:hypothetical protein